MPRAIWSGSVSFGLVNVPVRLHSAVRSKTVSFHQLDAETGSRIRYKKVAEETGEEVGADQIVKGYEISKGHYVTLGDEDLEAVEPEATRTIDIEDFVDIDDVDPLFFDRPYYLEPDGRGAQKAYALLVESLRKSGRAAVGRFVMRNKQYLVIIRPIENVLTIETMHYADEVVAPSEIEGVPTDVDLSKRELDAAERLIESLTTKWDPDKYRDTYRDKVLEMIERKAEGQEIVAPAAPSERKAEVIDLAAALEASLADREQPAKKKKAPAKKKAGKRKSA